MRDRHVPHAAVMEATNVIQVTSASEQEFLDALNDHTTHIELTANIEMPNGNDQDHNRYLINNTYQGSGTVVVGKMQP